MPRNVPQYALVALIATLISTTLLLHPVNASDKEWFRIENDRFLIACIDGVDWVFDLDRGSLGLVRGNDFIGMFYTEVAVNRTKYSTQYANRTLSANTSLLTNHDWILVNSTKSIELSGARILLAEEFNLSRTGVCLYRGVVKPISSTYFYVSFLKCEFRLKFSSLFVDWCFTNETWVWFKESAEYFNEIDGLDLGAIVLEESKGVPWTHVASGQGFWPTAGTLNPVNQTVSCSLILFAQNQLSRPHLRDVWDAVEAGSLIISFERLHEEEGGIDLRLVLIIASSTVCALLAAFFYFKSAHLEAAVLSVFSGLALLSAVVDGMRFLLIAYVYCAPGYALLSALQTPSQLYERVGLSPLVSIILLFSYWPILAFLHAVSIDTILAVSLTLTLAFGLLSLRRKRGSLRKEVLQTRMEFICLLVVIAVACFTALYHLNNVPGPHSEEGDHFTDAFLLQTQVLPFDYPTPFYMRMPTTIFLGYSYRALASVNFALLGTVSVWTMELGNAIYMISVAITGYLLATRVTRTPLALIAALFLVISPFFFYLSRTLSFFRPYLPVIYLLSLVRGRTRHAVPLLALLGVYIGSTFCPVTGAVLVVGFGLYSVLRGILHAALRNPRLWLVVALSALYGLTDRIWGFARWTPEKQATLLSKLEPFLPKLSLLSLGAVILFGLSVALSIILSRVASPKRSAITKLLLLLAMLVFLFGWLLNAPTAVALGVETQMQYLGGEIHATYALARSGLLSLILLFWIFLPLTVLSRRPYSLLTVSLLLSTIALSVALAFIGVTRFFLIDIQLVYLLLVYSLDLVYSLFGKRVFGYRVASCLLAFVLLASLFQVCYATAQSYLWFSSGGFSKNREPAYPIKIPKNPQGYAYGIEQLAYYLRGRLGDITYVFYVDSCLSGKGGIFLHLLEWSPYRQGRFKQFKVSSNVSDQAIANIVSVMVRTINEKPHVICVFRVDFSEASLVEQAFATSAPKPDAHQCFVKPDGTPVFSVYEFGYKYGSTSFGDWSFSRISLHGAFALFAVVVFSALAAILHTATKFLSMLGYLKLLALSILKFFQRSL